MIFWEAIMDEITYEEIPDMKQPYLVAGFEGWPNAAEVSSFSLQHLIDLLKAKRFASISLEPFCQVTSNRPMAVIKNGRLLELNLPGNHFYYSKDFSGKDLILFSGIEPHFRWTLFAERFLDLAQRFGVNRFFTLGGTYDYIPHSHPTRVSALFNHEELREEVLEAGLHLTEYVGPISIHTFLLEAARKRGLKGISLWGHAPQYLQARNIKVVYGVLQKLNELMNMEMDLSRLASASDFFEKQVNDLVKQDPKLQEILHQLEEAYQKSDRPFPYEKKEEPKEDKVVYIQAFLKRQEDEEKKED